jgi:hypothetical protein
VELAGALKNVYAIAAGVADGLGFENNTRASALLPYPHLALRLTEMAFQKFSVDHAWPVGDDTNRGGVWCLPVDFFRSRGRR